MIDLSGTSLKSALTYAYVRNKLAPTDASVAPSGYKTMLRAELAGLGGDVSYVKVGVSHAQSWSFGRLAPDTGYQAPLSQSGFLARLRAPAAAAAAAAAASSSSTDSDGSSSSSSSPAPPQPLPVHGPDGRLLRAHPVNASLLPGECSSAALEAAAAPPAPIVTGPSLDPRAAASAFVDLVTSPSTGDGHGLLRHASDVFTAASVTSAVAPAAPPAAAAPVAAPALPARYGAWHRLAGWLSPGLTVAVDAGAGVLVPFGADACRPSRITDRFFLTSSKLRGFDAVGPRAAPVPEGSIQGDLLGGDVTAHVTARALLPPPLPSVRLANAGLRTQLWATAAHVGPSAQRAAQSLGRLSALPAGEAAAAVARGASFAAGVGVVSGAHGRGCGRRLENACFATPHPHTPHYIFLQPHPLSLAGAAAGAGAGRGGQLRAGAPGGRQRPGRLVPHAAHDVSGAIRDCASVRVGGRRCCACGAVVDRWPEGVGQVGGRSYRASCQWRYREPFAQPRMAAPELAHSPALAPNFCTARDP